MDKELLDSVIDIVLNDKEKKNKFEKFDKLLLTFDNEEIDYFLEKCDESLYLNENLAFILARTIPYKMKSFTKQWIDNRLSVIDQLEVDLEVKYLNKEINKAEYQSEIKLYNEVRTSASKFLNAYFNEIDKEISKK